MPLVTTRVSDPDNPQRQHDQLTTLINYQAPFLSGGERAFTSYEVRHLLASEEQLQSDQKPLVDPAVFKDKIVFIGLTTSGLVDVFSTPFGVDKGNMPGIQLHATMADNLLSNRFIRPASRGARIGDRDRRWPPRRPAGRAAAVHAGGRRHAARRRRLDLVLARRRSRAGSG